MYFDTNFSLAINNNEKFELSYLIAKNTGNFVDKQKLAIALSEDMPTFVDKETRNTLNIRELIDYYSDKNLNYQNISENDFEIMVRILSTTPRREFSDLTEKTISTFLQMYKNYKSEKKELLFLKLLLTGQVLQTLPFQQVIGRVILHKSIPDIIPRSRSTLIEGHTNLADPLFKKC